MAPGASSAARWWPALLASALMALMAVLPPHALGAAELQVFVRQGCPHCGAAKAFLPELQRRHPEVRVRLRDVGTDPQARADLLRLSRQAGADPPGVPTFAYGDRVLVGFDGPAGRGRDLLALLEDPQTRGATAVEEGAGELDLGPLGRLRVTSVDLPLFTLAMGLLDGFNPCAMWVLLFLLSLLVHWRNRRRMALVAGTFVLVSGAVYFAFMAAWLNIFLLLGWSPTLRLVLTALALTVGAVNVLDSQRRGSGFTLSIPTDAKPGLYARLRNVVQTHSLLPAMAAVAVLAVVVNAVVVNAVELLCTAGLPALYTAALTSHKLTEADGRWLKLISGGVMLALGGILLLRPGWLL